MPDQNAPTLILGGGFAGLFTALNLSQMGYRQPITLIDQEEHFAFKPLLYELVSDEMEEDQVIPRYAELLADSKVTFVQDRVTAVDLQERQVQLASGLQYSYARLVLTLGSCIGYANVEGAREYSFPFRTGKDAKTLKTHLQDVLLKASQSEDPQHRQQLLTVAIVGAGPTGIELAATLADWLPERFRQLGGDGSEIRIVLLHRGDEILQGDMNDHLRETVKSALPRRNVPVQLTLQTEVAAVRPDGLTITHQGQTEGLPTATCIWTAGTETNPLLMNLKVPADQRDRHGQLKVTPTLQLLGFPDVFAGGDCAIDAEKPLPPVAQVAYQQGYTIAHNLKALDEGNALMPFQVHLRGTLMKLGIGEGAAELYDRYEIKGHFGSLLRQARYLELLPTPIHNFKATTEWLTDVLFHKMHKASQ